MDQTSLNNYYKTLNAKPYCNVKELRKAYKIQIQKWHPDKHINDPTKKVFAEQKTIRVNQAYKHLLHQYRKFGQPVKPVNTIQKPKSVIIPTHKSDTAHTKKAVKANDSPYKGYLPIFLPIFMTTLMIILYLNEAQESAEKNHVDTNLETAKSSIQPNNSLSISSDAYSDPSLSSEEELSFYTEGSSTKDVITVQGVPSEIKDNKWFYGKSEVHFKNGKVINWIRRPGYPLKARINLVNHQLSN